MNEVLLVGNPNTGKTTLFNKLTKSFEHTGNWHGVTVEEKGKYFRAGDLDFYLVDLPGIYSLSSLSFEEGVSRDYIYAHKDSKIINICDVANLRRNLYLTLGLIECGLDVVVAINSIDKKYKTEVDFSKLSKKLGVDFISINAENGEGLDELKNSLFKKKSSLNLQYLNKLPIKRLREKIIDYYPDNTDFYAIKVLEGDEKALENLPEEFKSYAQPQLVAKVRYDYIDEVIGACVKVSEKTYGQSKLDKFFMNKYLAFPLFLIILSGIFFITFFTFGKWMSAGLECLLDAVFSPIEEWLISLFGKGSWLVAMIIEALFGGVGLVLSFLPQVALLFMCLSILEDSGYLARVAFMFEDIFSKIGLSGKGVYTLLMGFGCSTTAVLTARTMDDRNAKIKTAMLTPYMSCSAKFPIYLVIGGAFFEASNIWIIIGLYLLGVIVSLLLSFIMEKTVLKSREQAFILEFPPYHIPSMKRVMKVLWENVKLFVVRVGSIIISMNVIVWLLSNFSFSFAYVGTSGGSMLESIGRFISPIFIPLGFGNWGASSALIAGLVAKEVVVSSILMFNGGLSIVDPSSAVYFSNPASVISFLIFCLLYSPCMATIAVLDKEIGKKWTIISIVMQLAIAYLTSLFFYNILLACLNFGVWQTILVLFGVLIVIASILVVFEKVKCKKCSGDCSRCKRK